MYRLGEKSLKNLQGVHKDLADVVKRAIQISDQDFAVHEGLRTLKTQQEYVKKGASWTMEGRHLTGHAVDLVPWEGGMLRWEWNLIFPIAVAMDIAATELKVPLRWGGVWDKLMTEYGGSSLNMKKEVAAYCDRHPGPDKIDGPHFELPKRVYP